MRDFLRILDRIKQFQKVSDYLFAIAYPRPDVAPVARMYRILTRLHVIPRIFDPLLGIEVTGYLLFPGDPQSFAVRLDGLIASPALIETPRQSKLHWKDHPALLVQVGGPFQ